MGGKHNYRKLTVFLLSVLGLVMVAWLYYTNIVQAVVHTFGPIEVHLRNIYILKLKYLAAFVCLGLTSYLSVSGIQYKGRGEKSGEYFNKEKRVANVNGV